MIFDPVCRDVYIPVDYMTRLPRGIAFIEFTDPKDAEDAIYGLDRKLFDGREVGALPWRAAWPAMKSLAS